MLVLVTYTAAVIAGNGINLFLQFFGGILFPTIYLLVHKSYQR
jgi:hypothetical protein